MTSLSIQNLKILDSIFVFLLNIETYTHIQITNKYLKIFFINIYYFNCPNQNIIIQTQDSNKKQDMTVETNFQIKYYTLLTMVLFCFLYQINNKLFLFFFVLIRPCSSYTNRLLYIIIHELLEKELGPQQFGSFYLFIAFYKKYSLSLCASIDIFWFYYVRDMLKYNELTICFILWSQLFDYLDLYSLSSTATDIL